jgi:hypothetical protein
VAYDRRLENHDWRPNPHRGSRRPERGLSSGRAGRTGLKPTPIFTRLQLAGTMNLNSSVDCAENNETIEKTTSG